MRDVRTGTTRIKCRFKGCDGTMVAGPKDRESHGGVVDHLVVRNLQTRKPLFDHDIRPEEVFPPG